MTQTDAIAKVYIQFTKLNPTLINCVNKKAQKDHKKSTSLHAVGYGNDSDPRLMIHRNYFPPFLLKLAWLSRIFGDGF